MTNKTYVKCLMASICTIITLSLTTGKAEAQTAGDYRSTASGLWSNAANWETYDGSAWQTAVTAPNFNNGMVTIRTGDSIYVSSNLTIDETTVENGAVLTVVQNISLTVTDGNGDDLTVNGRYYLHGNMPYGGSASATVVINNTMYWIALSAQSEITASNTIISPGAQLIIDGAANKSFRYSGGVINNSGSILWYGTGNIRGGSNTINNLTGATFTAYNDQEIQYDGGGGSLITFNNSGTFLKTGGSGTTAFPGCTFNNNGLADCASGTLRFGSNGSHSGIFRANAPATIQFTAGTHTLTNGSVFTGDGTLSQTGGTLNFEGNSAGTIADTNLNYNFINGNLGGSGKFTIHGIFNWMNDAGTCEITTMNTTVSTTGIMNISGAGNKSFRYSGGAINNYGQIQWSGTGNIRGASNTINNHPGALFLILNDQEMQYDGGGGTYLLFNNSGTLQKQTATGITSFASARLFNNGLCEVLSGSLTLNANGSHSGTFYTAAGCSTTITGGNHDADNGTLFTGPGDAGISGGSLNFTGTTTGAVIDTFVTFHYTGGNMGGSGKATLYGNMDWSSPTNNGTQFTTASFTIAATASMNITGIYSRNFKGNLYNYGNIVWSGDGAVIGGNGSITNHSSGVIDIQADCGLYYDGGGAGPYTFINDGLIVKSAGIYTTEFSHVSFTNNGTIRVETGTLNLSSTFTNFSNNTLSGGRYYIIGDLRFNNANVLTNQAHITMDGPDSDILNNTGSTDALQNFTTNGSNGVFILRNGRNISTQAATFTNLGILDCDTSTFGGNGHFAHEAYATLILGSPDGITLASDTGNIRSLGSRTYSTTANYTYRGYVSQMAGNGMPATARKLTLDNAQGLTLMQNTVVSDSLLMLAGNIHTGNDTLSLGITTTQAGELQHISGWIHGIFRRWFASQPVSDALLPIGTTSFYRPATISFTAAPSGGTLTAAFNENDPGLNGLLITETDILSDVCEEGYWTLSPSDNLSGGVYDLSLGASGFAWIDDPSRLHILKRPDPAQAWIPEGTHQAGSGTPADPLAHRSGLTTFSDFGIAYPRPYTALSGCDSLTAQNGVTYTESEVIRLHVPGQQQPDSLLIISITIDTLILSVTSSPGMLTADQNGGQYQWLDCDNAFLPLSGETQQNFSPAVSGNYAVIVTHGSCSDTSLCINFIYTGLNDESQNQMIITPNPTNGIINIRNLKAPAGFSILDLSGRIVMQSQLQPGANTLDVSFLEPGLYYIRMESPSVKTFKFIKK